MFSNNFCYFLILKKYVSMIVLFLRDNSMCLKIFVLIYVVEEYEKWCSCFGKSLVVC